jgi:hypothetical protein
MHVPVAAQVVEKLELVQLQVRGKFDQATLADVAVVEENAIVVCAAEAANIDFPGIVPERVVLRYSQGKMAGKAG